MGASSPVELLSLSKTFYPLLSTGLTQEDPSDLTENFVNWDVKNQDLMSQ